MPWRGAITRASGRQRGVCQHLGPACFVGGRLRVAVRCAALRSGPRLVHGSRSPRIGDEIQRTILHLVVNAAQILPDDTQKDQLNAAQKEHAHQGGGLTGKGLLPVRRAMIVIKMPSRLTPARAKPAYVASCSGTWLKLVMALSASRSIFRRGTWSPPRSVRPARTRRPPA